ncbi:Oxidoreductase family, NAD-binding Rossmann fold [Geobacillus sp. BCO2]|nr:Oxidoreductase family, NAD-binding Rossmann fold [Geobacillus sp. BCO2]
MNRINVGIIGTGFSASSHIEALRRLPFVNIVAIASSSQEKAEEAARHSGFRKRTAITAPWWTTRTSKPCTTARATSSIS